MLVAGCDRGPQGPGGWVRVLDERREQQTIGLASEQELALLEAMLDTWERAATDEVREQVERRGGDARTKVRRAGALTFSNELLPIDLAIRDWARHDAAVAARLRRVDNRRMEYLRQLFRSLCANEEEIEARAVLAFSLAIGYHFIAADHGARDRSDRLRSRS